MTDEKRRKLQIVGWEITSRCNLACPHCYTAAARRGTDIFTTADCRRLIDALAGVGTAMIGWTGGEPLLRDDLEELTAYAADRGITTNITTNAILLTEERARRLLDAGNRAVQISLDGSTPELNRRMRGTTEEEFARIVDAIRICKRLNIRVHLASLLGRETLDDAPEMMKLAKREGVDAIRFCGFAPIGRGKRQDVQARLQISSDAARLHRFIRAAQADSDMVTLFDISFGPVAPDYAVHTCIAGIETCYLKANGDVYPCTALLHRRFCVGNLKKHSFEEIWNSAEMSALANYPREQLEGTCPRCDNWQNCRGACRGTTFAQVGDLNASFPNCLYQVAMCESVGFEEVSGLP